MKRYIILLFTFLLLDISCQKNKKHTEIGQIISEWTGKQIQFSQDYFCNILGKDTVSAFCSDLLDREYKILLYVDSTGCSDCRLKLFEWKRFIVEAGSLFGEQLGFLLFFQPKNKKEMNFLFQVDQFDYPVFIDTKNTINQMNHFPAQPQYQCFLLDKNNKVLMIGNPVLNPKIWELYKERITGEKSASNKPQTVAMPDKTVHNYGTIQKGSKNKATFVIRNTGSNPLTISRVSASCGCTNVNWDKEPVEPGGTAIVSTEMTPDETGYFNKTIEVFGNFENSPVKLAVTGTVKNELRIKNENLSIPSPRHPSIRQ